MEARIGKVLRAVAVIAIVAAVAYFAPTLAPQLLSSLSVTASAGALAAATAVITAAGALAAGAISSLLTPKPKPGDIPLGVTRQTIGNSYIIYGRRRVGGLLIFFHPIGKDYRYFVIAVAGHRCKGVTRWWLGDEQVTVDGSGKVLMGKYAGNAWLWFYRGTEDQQAHPTFVAETQGKWTTSHRARNTALIYAKFKMTDDVVQAGMPNITAEVEGKDDILDPRTEARGYTRNAALIFYDWIAMRREEGGFGAYDDEIDWDWVSAQANVCDEQVPTPAGNEARYALDCYLQTGAAPSEVRDTLVTCCAGSFTYSGGKMLMRPGYYVPPSASLKEHDLAGAITVPALLGGDEIANEVTGTYIEPGQYQPADVPTRSTLADDVRQQSVDLPHVTSIYQGQRILEYVLRKAQAERRVTWPMNIMGIAISTLDTVQLATARYGLSNYAFQVTGWGLSQDFSVVLQLEEHSADLFDFTADMYHAVGNAPDLDRADPISDIPASVEQLVIANSYPINISIISADNAGSATVSVSDHDRVYSDRTVHVDAATLSGLQNSTLYYLYYDDPERDGGAVTVAAAVNYPDAFASSSQPARHFLGSVTTAATGGTNTGGGGGTPPGGGGTRNPNVAEY